jgi:hypothetical protein
MTWNGCRATCGGVSIHVMLATGTSQYAAFTYETANELLTLQAGTQIGMNLEREPRRVERDLLSFKIS